MSVLTAKCTVRGCKEKATHEAISLSYNRCREIKRTSALVCFKHRDMFIQKRLRWTSGLASKTESVRATTELLVLGSRAK